MDSPRTPPKPVLTLRLGVTGHRPDKLSPEQIDRVRPLVAAALERLWQLLHAVQGKYSHYYDDSGPVLRLVSGLAEGADRVVATAAMQSGARVVALLPFPRDIYLNDFADETSRAEYRSLLRAASAVVELDGRYDSSETRNRAYLAAGSLMVEQTDVIIALWNGDPARGSGGTGQIVENARMHARPVLWLPTVGSDPPQLLLGSRKPSSDAIADLALAVETILIPPAGSLVTYLAERCPERRTGRFFSGLFKRFCAVVIVGRGNSAMQPHSSFEAPPAGPDAGVEPCTGSRDLGDQRLEAHYRWADDLAGYYGGLYRSAYLASYLLAAFALWTAAPWIDRPAGELVLVLLILAITFAGIRGQWHQHWIEYRDLAERVRVLRFLRGFPSPAASPILPKHLAAQQQPGDWIRWCYQAIVREARLPSMILDRGYCQMLRHRILAEEVEPQIAYHAGNAHRLHRFDHRLHRAGIALFVLTALVCLLHFAVHFLLSEDQIEASIHPSVDSLEIMLPALGAAIYAIRNQGEFARLARRSKQMETLFADIRNKLAGPPATELDAGMLTQTVHELAVTMLSETSEWHFVLVDRPLSLPA